MIIRFSAEQEARLLKAAGEWLAAEVEADCLPSGYVLEIWVGGPEGANAEVVGLERLDLGEVKLEWDPVAH